MVKAATHLYEQLFNKSISPRCITNVVGEFMFCNISFKKIFDLELEGDRLNLLNINDLFKDDQSFINSDFDKEFEKFKEGLGFTTGKLIYINALGRKFNFDFHREIIKIENEEFVSYEFHDVTDKVVISKSLKSVNESVQLTADINLLGVWEYSFDQKDISLNDRMFSIYGFDESEYTGDPNYFRQFFPESEMKIFLDAVNGSLIHKEKFSIEVKANNPKTGERILQINGKCLFNSQNQPWKLVGTTADVTEFYKKQKTILTDRARLRSLVDSQSNYIVRINQNGEITFCNQSFRGVFGINLVCSGEEKLSDFLRKEDAEPLELCIKSCLRNRGKSIHLLTGSQLNGYSVIAIDWEFTAIVGNSDETTEIQAVGKDISEKNQLRTKVEEALSNLTSLINNFHNVSIWSIDTEMKLTASNNHFQNEFLSFHGNEIYPGDYIIDKLRPELKDLWIQLNNDIFENGSREMSYELDERFFEVSFSPIIVNNEVKGLTAYGRDVTESRLAANALKLSEERLQFAIEGNEYAVWDLSTKSNEIKFSDSFYHILGWDKEKFNDSLELWSELVHPEDLARTGITFEKMTKGEIEEFSSEFRIMDSQENYRWFLNRGKIFEKDTNGKASRILGILSDISDRKNSESVIKQNIEKLEKFAHLTSHNLRKPLANIIGIASLLKEDALAIDKDIKLISEIKKSAHSLDAVVKEMTEAISFGSIMRTASAQTSLKLVWFIDDDIVNNMLSEKLVERVLPETIVKTFTNAEEALDILINQNFKPDSIFLDINMPRMNGWEFLDSLTVHQINISVYMLTSSIDPRDQEKAVKFKLVKDFISKPLREERLRLIIE
ncbi:MAG: PAS domain-containing protein [Bacteroidia bacterium]